METINPSLSIENMVKIYGTVRAVDHVSIEVRAGEIFGLLGENGAGKTSLIECALGLREADSGTVTVAGMDARTQRDEVKRRIGAVLQATALQDAITPREALELFGAFYRKTIPPGVLMERFGLMEKADARFETLSGGQRQRLALALAFVNDPAVLFLDEPTAGLDPQVRRSLHDAIRQCRAEGRAVLLTTHYIEEAHALCDRIAILHRGKIVALGTPEELIERSGSGTRIFVRTARRLDTTVLEQLPTIAGAAESDGGVSVRVSETGPAIIEIVHHLEATRNELLDLQVRKPSLEDVFIEFTSSGAAS